MKKLLMGLVLISITFKVSAQSPDKMSYQCIVRNSSGALVTNQNIGFRISILQGSTTGTVVYQEIYNPNPQTNANGLVNMEIGNGTALIGTFASIDWSSGAYFLKTETDLTGGTNYTISGTTQLLSVPYAMYAKTAESVTGGIIETDPIWDSVSTNYYNKSNMQTSGESILHFNNLASKPTTVIGYGIIDAITTSGNQTIAGNKTFNGTTTVAAPVNATDAATKAYVDGILDKVLQIQAELGVKDVDGNTYKVIKIGTQLWMAENLRTTRYRGGSIIGINTSGPIGDYTWPVGGSENNVPKYGRLYTHYAASDSACPIGWRLPEYIDWRRLTNGSDSIYTEDIEGSDFYIEFPVGKSLAANTDWQTNEIDGSVGNKQETNNSSGFNGLPAGSPGGNIGAYGTWWIRENISYAEIEGDSKNLFIHIRYPFSPAHATSILNQGKSVRCTKGILSPILSTSAVTSVTQITATSGGYITSDGGAYVTSRGVCWSTSPNPTIVNDRTIDGSGTGAFTSSIIGLNGNTTYYVRAYATNSTVTNYGNEVIFKTYTGTVSDIDGNPYNTVVIGTQVWMAENLRTAKYNDGTPIPLVTDSAAWATLSIPGYCWYNNDEATYKDTYGALYNWYSVNTGKLCPIGWSVPTWNDRYTLMTYLGGDIIANDKLKETGTIHWESPNAGTNESGFTALPGRIRNSNGAFNSINQGYYWVSEVQLPPYPGVVFFSIPMRDITPASMRLSEQFGISIRCLKDN